jgi:membrane-associated phospholipid phosphatase
MRLGAGGRITLFLMLWALALGLAFLLDRRVADWVRHAPLYHRSDRFVPILKLPGNFFFTLAVCAVLAMFHRNRWRAALPLLISGPMVGLVYLFLKWSVGRRRPVIVDAPFDFHPFAHGLMGFVHSESGLSFPSGHASLAFATATCLAAVMPRGAIVFFFLAIAVGAERVLENAHYVSDVVAGAGLGIISGWIAIRLVSRCFSAEANRGTGLQPLDERHSTSRARSE